MRRNQARLQMLTLGLLGLFGLLSLDLAPVQALMGGYLGDPLIEAVEAEAAEAPDVALRTVEGPALAVGGPAKRDACPACSTPDVIGLEAEAVAQAAAVAIPFASPAHATQETDGALLPTLLADRRKAWSTLAAAERALELDAGQKASWQRTLHDARRDMDDLRHVPNEDGATWHAISASILVSGGDFSQALTQARKLADFVQSTLRGGETYLAARTRIVAGYEDRLRADLTPEQEPIFDAHDVGPLFDPVRLAHVRVQHLRKQRVVSRLRVLRS